MAPVAAPPIPTPPSKLPKLKAPAGFKVEVYQSGVLDARGLRRGDKGTIFVSSLFVAGKIYAITGEKGKREVKTILSELELPNGIEFSKGSLYVATPKQITRYDNIEDNLDKPPQPVMVYDKLPGDVPHGWKFIRFGPDDKLYVPVGAPCNICDPDPEKYAQIFRINADGSGMEIVARGVRNTVGFDFHPQDQGAVVHRQPARLAGRGLPARRAQSPGEPRQGSLRLSLLPLRHDDRSGVRLGQVVRRLREAGGTAGPAYGSARHALLYGHDVPGEVSQRHLHRASRPLEPHARSTPTCRWPMSTPTTR